MPAVLTYPQRSKNALAAKVIVERTRLRSPGRIGAQGSASPDQIDRTGLYVGIQGIEISSVSLPKIRNRGAACPSIAASASNSDMAAGLIAGRAASAAVALEPTLPLEKTDSIVG